MIIWTIQTQHVWKQLQATGELSTNTTLLIGDLGSLWQQTQVPYEWLAQQMSKRISPRPEPNAFPPWGWYQYNGINHKRPDLRHPGHVARGMAAVRLAVEISTQDLLLSDFNLWHAPLNLQYLAASKREEQHWEKQLKARDAQCLSYLALPHELRLAVQNSWEHIFEVDRPNHYWETTPDNSSIQATFWRLSLDQVQEVTHLTGR